jgi:hypothetical protein
VDLLTSDHPVLVRDFQGTFSLATTPVPGPLLTDGSFEEGLWSGLTYIGDQPPPGARAAASPEAADGTRSLELTTPVGTVYDFQRIAHFSPLAVYRVELDYQHVEGAPPSVGVYQTGAASYAYVNDHLDTSPGWHHLSVVVRPSDQASGMFVFLYSHARGDRRTVNRYDGVRVTAARLPTDLIVTSGDHALAPARAVPAERASRAGWRATVTLPQGGGWVVLPQGFDPEWHLTATTEEGRAVPVRNHERVDGWANGWFVDGEGTVVLDVGYGGPSAVAIGLAVSIAALIGTGLALVLARRRRS